MDHLATIRTFIQDMPDAMAAFTPEGSFLFCNAAMDGSAAADALCAYMAGPSSLQVRRSGLQSTKPMLFRFDDGGGQYRATLRLMLPDVMPPALLVQLLRAADAISDEGDARHMRGNDVLSLLPEMRAPMMAIPPAPAETVSELQLALSELRTLIATQRNEEAAAIAVEVARAAENGGAHDDSVFFRSIALRLGDGLPLDAQQSDRLRTLWSQTRARQRQDPET
jgi:hypothetical protein